MPDCGHTFCEYCIADILTSQPSECSDCKRPVRTKQLDKFRKNYQIVDVMKNMKYPQILAHDKQDPINNAIISGCGRHPDTVVEYFCKTCSLTICPKCVYEEHNGHDLVQIEEMAEILKKNVIDLQKMILQVSRLNDENAILLEQTKDELSKLKAEQLKNID